MQVFRTAPHLLGQGICRRPRRLEVRPGIDPDAGPHVELVVDGSGVIRFNPGQVGQLRRALAHGLVVSGHYASDVEASA